MTLTGVNPSLVVSCTCAFCIHQLHTPITFYHFTVSHSAPCPQQIIAFYSPIRPTTDLFSLACCDHNNTMFWHWMVVQDSSMAPQQDNVCVLVLLLWLPAKMSYSRVFYYSRDCDVVPVFCKWEINLNSPMGTLSRGLQADCLSVHRISRLSHRLCVMLSDSLGSGCMSLSKSNGELIASAKFPLQNYCWTPTPIQQRVTHYIIIICGPSILVPWNVAATNTTILCTSYFSSPLTDALNLAQIHNMCCCHESPK